MFASGSDGTLGYYYIPSNWEPYWFRCNFIHGQGYSHEKLFFSWLKKRHSKNISFLKMGMQLGLFTLVNLDFFPRFVDSCFVYIDYRQIIVSR